METPSSRSNLNSRRVVRVVGKVRPLFDSQPPCNPISISRSDEGQASISFGQQTNGRKDSYNLDWCYGEDEGASEIFTKEVKPLLQGILNGTNACVIAYGAPGSGKTQLIQGTEENPGLAFMAVSEILPAVMELGGSVMMSCYEIRHDHVYDLLDPKDQEVLIMEGAGQRIQLKGLSQIPLRTIPEFKTLFFCDRNLQKPSQKVKENVTIRSHRGLILYISFFEKESNHPVVSKMSFVDLAGYEHVKKKDIAKSTLPESTKVNKSLYALLNVVQALNSDGIYVPYRENKLTRLLQDFISKSTNAVLVTCLNPALCQDTVHAVRVASRSCQTVNQYQHSSVKNSKSGSKLAPCFSATNGKMQALDASMKKLEVSQSCSIEKKGREATSETKRRLQPLSNSFKKTGTFVYGSVEKKLGTSIKKKSSIKSMTKERKLSNPTNPSTFSYKKNCMPISVDHLGHCSLTEDLEPTMSKEETYVSGVATSPGPPMSDLDVCVAHVNDHLQQNQIGCSEVDATSANEHNHLGGADIELGVTSYYSDQHDGTIKNSSAIDVDISTPRVSDRLREISNSLKLWSSKPISISIPQNISCNKHFAVEISEPQTPRDLHQLDYNSRFEDIGTPQDRWRTRSAGLKKSLVKECLTFLNSANKEELKALKGIGEKRATYIVDLREQTPEPFKEMDDLKELGLSSKQIKGIMTKILGDV